MGLVDLLGRSSQFEVVFLNGSEGASFCIIAPEGLPDSFTVRRSVNSNLSEPPVELSRTMTLKIRTDDNDSLGYDGETLEYIIKTLLEREKISNRTTRTNRKDKEEDDFPAGGESLETALQLFNAMEVAEGRALMGDRPLVTNDLIANSQAVLELLLNSSTMGLVKADTQTILNISDAEVEKSQLVVEIPSSTNENDHTSNNPTSQAKSILNIDIFSNSNSNANIPIDISSYTNTSTDTEDRAESENSSGLQTDPEPLSPLSLPDPKSVDLVTTDGSSCDDKEAGLSSSKHAAASETEQAKPTLTVNTQFGLPRLPEVSPISTIPLPPSPPASENSLSSRDIASICLMSSPVRVVSPKIIKTATSATDSTIPNLSVLENKALPKAPISTEPSVVTTKVPGIPSSALIVPTRGSATEITPTTVTTPLRPQIGVKKWCSFFFQYGKCAYMQTGCRFSHEQPPPGVDIFSEYYGRENEMPREYFSEHPTRNGGVSGGGLTAREARLAIDAREQKEALKKAARGLCSSRYSSGTETKASKNLKLSKKGGKKIILPLRKSLDDVDNSETSDVSKERKRRGRRGKEKLGEKTRIVINSNGNETLLNGVMREELLVNLDEDTSSELVRFESLLK